MQTKAQLPHLGQEYSSQWDNIYPYSEIGRWVTDTTTGALKYKLDPLDSSKKLDGSPSVLDGTDGDVMVKVPRFGYKVEFNEDGTSNYYITANRPNDTGSNLPEGFKIHPAFRRGDGTFAGYFLYGAFTGHTINTQLRSVAKVLPTGRSKTIGTLRNEARNGRGLEFGLPHMNMLSALQILYICEFQNLNSQAMLGLGKTSTSESSITTGDSLSLGDRSGYVDSGRGGNGKESAVYRGIEDFFGACWDFVDGVMFSGTSVYITEKPADFGNTSLSKVITITKPTAGYITKMNQINEIDNLFIPSVSGTDNTTYYTDHIDTWSSSLYMAVFGGIWDIGAFAGVFCLDLGYYVSSAGGRLAGRLCILPKGGN